MGRGQHSANSILYGELQARAQAADAHGRLLDNGQLNVSDPIFLRERYFQNLIGYSGAEHWFAKAKQLPGGWYDPDDNLDNGAEGKDFIQEMFDRDSTGILDDAYHYQECNLTYVEHESEEDGVVDVGVEHKYDELYAPSREILAIEHLAGQGGEWRYFDAAEPEGPVLVYYQPEEAEILGAVRCVFQELQTNKAN